MDENILRMFGIDVYDKSSLKRAAVWGLIRGVDIYVSFPVPIEKVPLEDWFRAGCVAKLIAEADEDILGVDYYHDERKIVVDTENEPVEARVGEDYIEFSWEEVTDLDKSDWADIVSAAVTGTNIPSPWVPLPGGETIPDYEGEKWFDILRVYFDGRVEYLEKGRSGLRSVMEIRPPECDCYAEEALRKEVSPLLKKVVNIVGADNIHSARIQFESPVTYNPAYTIDIILDSESGEGLPYLEIIRRRGRYYMKWALDAEHIPILIGLRDVLGKELLPETEVAIELLKKTGPVSSYAFNGEWVEVRGKRMNLSIHGLHNIGFLWTGEYRKITEKYPGEFLELGKSPGNNYIRIRLPRNDEEVCVELP